MSVHQWSCCTSQLLKMRLKSTLRSRQTAGTLPADVALNLPSGIVFSFTLILPPGILHDVPGDCLGAPGWLHGARTWYVEMIIWSGGVFIVETPSQMTPFVYYGSSWWHERQCGRDRGDGGQSGDGEGEQILILYQTPFYISPRQRPPYCLLGWYIIIKRTQNMYRMINGVVVGVLPRFPPLGHRFVSHRGTMWIRFSVPTWLRGFSLE